MKDDNMNLFLAQNQLYQVKMHANHECIENANQWRHIEIVQDHFESRSENELIWVPTSIKVVC
jgi:hypothetical protein